jgi:hypothetical protein
MFLIMYSTNITIVFNVLKINVFQVWLHGSIIPALSRVRQEDREFKAN